MGNKEVFMDGDSCLPSLSLSLGLFPCRISLSLLAKNKELLVGYSNNIGHLSQRREAPENMD